jgi:hypothetical protein
MLIELLLAPFKIVAFFISIGIWLVICILSYGMLGWFGLILLHALLAAYYWPKRNKDFDVTSIDKRLYDVDESHKDSTKE